MAFTILASSASTFSSSFAISEIKPLESVPAGTTRREQDLAVDLHEHFDL